MQRNDIEIYCKFCENAKTLSDPDCMVCEKYGIVPSSHSCRRFVYDPLKRSPKRAEKKVSLEYVDV